MSDENCCTALQQCSLSFIDPLCACLQRIIRRAVTVVSGRQIVMQHKSLRISFLLSFQVLKEVFTRPQNAFLNQLPNDLPLGFNIRQSSGRSAAKMAVVKIVCLIGFIFLMVKIEGRHRSLFSHSVKFVCVCVCVCVCVYIYIYIYIHTHTHTYVYIYIYIYIYIHI